jgi:DNA repair photolyase
MNNKGGYMIGITERGDAALNLEWIEWVNEGKPAILITKDIGKLVHTFDDAFLEKANVIVHATITGLNMFEPNVPPLARSLCGLEHMVKLIGKDRVVLRIDPIIPTRTYIPQAIEVYRKAMHLGLRTRISFLDAYSHVRERFKGRYEFPWIGIHAPLNYRMKALEMLNIPDVEICGEPDMKCTGCISQKDLDVFGIPTQHTGFSKQRKECRCLALKHELLTSKHPCAHGCEYCYWKN